MYDGVLRVKLPQDVHIIGFADDIALVITAKHLPEVRDIATSSVNAVRTWLTAHGLMLAGQKTEAVLISSRKKSEDVSFRIGEHEISTKPAIKYLGILIDRRLTFKAHLEYIQKRQR